MRILADENIPVVDAFFADQGSIRRLPGRAIVQDGAGNPLAGTSPRDT
ncbi:hypothetical protein RBU07_19840, partial [Pseudomonas aeruginosa]|nr:hypothetical protein [Pseudomonas aeruginosa]